jgi:hypothetical protein
MFKDFFERFGSIKGVSIKQRLSIDKAPTWAQFLEHVGGPESPYYRYVFHQESGIDLNARSSQCLAAKGSSSNIRLIDI